MQSPHKRKISVFESQMVHLLNRNFVVKIRIPVNVNSKDLLSKARKNTKVQTFKKRRSEKCKCFVYAGNKAVSKKPEDLY